MIPGVKIVPSAEYRTQKAAGLKALRDYNFQTPPFEVFGVEYFDFESPFDVPIISQELSSLYEQAADLRTMKESCTNPDLIYYLVSALSTLENEIHRKSKTETIGMKQLGFFPERQRLDRMVNRFVRPCPMIPRHGFVDSRPINSIEEAERILEETLRVEDRAEFIIMPFIPAEYSGIWTPGKLVIGSGNDGATAGHSSRVIPALGQPANQSWKGVLSAGRITESPYIELLWAKKYDYDPDLIKYFVQLRNGPLLPETTDFIPEEIEVTEVVLASGDLLEWETKAKNFARGTVVYHPGGSLASHYAVHAVLSKTPVMISHEPKIGDVLKPNTEMKEPKIDDIRKGFYLGATVDISLQTAAHSMIVGCHSVSAWLGTQDVLLGFAMGCAYRLTITAALGEFRHEPGRKRKPKREIVYNGVWDKILTSATRTRYVKALDSFKNDSRWPGSFGGKKWYIFASYAGAIFNNILDGDIKESLENLNKCVNAVHNGGWAFDKFVNREVMDTCAVNPSILLIDIAPHLYNVLMKSDEAILDWFKGKHHVDVEPLDEDGARRDEEEEEKAGTQENNLYEGCREESSDESRAESSATCDDPTCVLCQKKKEIPIGKVMKAQLTVDSTGKGWVQWQVANQDDFRSDYFLSEVYKDSQTVEDIYKAKLLIGEVVPSLGDSTVPYVPLTVVYESMYLHTGKADAPNYGWSLKKKYVSFFGPKKANAPISINGTFGEGKPI